MVQKDLLIEVGKGEEDGARTHDLLNHNQTL